MPVLLSERDLFSVTRVVRQTRISHPLSLGKQQLER